VCVFVGVCVCVCACVCALAQSTMTAERFIAPHQSDQCLSTPGLDTFSANVLLEEASLSAGC